MMRSKYAFTIVLMALLVVTVATVPVHSFHQPMAGSLRPDAYKMYEPMGRIVHPVPHAPLSEAYGMSAVSQNGVSYYDMPNSAAEIDTSGDRGTNGQRSVAITCTVTTTADAGPGSLRQCLLDAIPNDTINFDPPTFPPGAPATIVLSSALPIITINGLTIDGSNAGVILAGSGLFTGNGLVVSGADGVVIRGLHILNFPEDGLQLIAGTTNATIGGDIEGDRNIISGNTRAGIAILHNGTIGNQVLGNYIGTDASGVAQIGNRWGVVLAFGAQDNIIGGDMPGANNVISGNDFGVQFQDIGTSGNQMVNNYIGTDAAGVMPLGNRTGVVILSGAQSNVVGGETPGSRNVISGNVDLGVHITDSSTSDNRVSGNYVGTTVNGMTPLSNTWGIQISFGAHDNIIGGVTDGARNVISGNDLVGVVLRNVGTIGNLVQGNYIGTDVMGMTSLGNTWGVGIVLGATENVIGGESQEKRNVISGNQVGIQLEDDGTSGNRVLGNYIGTDVTGTAPLGNDVSGVVIRFGAQNNVIGGETAEARNIISGNDLGVWLQNGGTDNNKVWGNYIGTDVKGAIKIGNRQGVGIGFGASNNIIGGETDVRRNIISGNTQLGVWLQDNGTMGNQVLGNYIGTTVTGTEALGNGVSGVALGIGAENNIIGGETTGAGNIISANPYSGIHLQDLGTSGNQIQGNYIGTDVTGTQAVGTSQYGISLVGGSSNNLIGPDNKIAYKQLAGIALWDTTTLGNTVTHNSIYLIGGPPIDFIDMPSPIPAPSLSYCALDSTLSGNTCSACRVEIFTNPTLELAGTMFLDEVIADTGGDFTIALTVPAAFPYLSVTVTDMVGTTSEYYPVPQLCHLLYLPAITNE